MERKIITLLITNTRFCQEVLPMIRSQFFETPYAKTIYKILLYIYWKNVYIIWYVETFWWNASIKINVEENRVFIEGNGNPRSYAGHQPPSIKTFYLQNNMYGYIYKTMNLINGKIYIGQKQSSKFKPYYLGSGKLLKLAIKKYGIENFHVWIICRCNSFKMLNKKEIYYIKKYNSTNNKIGYNIIDGGYNFIKGHPCLWKEKLSKLHKGIPISEKHKLAILEGKRKSTYDPHHSLETRKKISKTHKEHPYHHTEENKLKMSLIKKGKPLSEEHKKKLSIIGKGRKQSPEWIQKRVDSYKGYRHTEESKEKNRQWHLGKKWTQESIDKRTETRRKNGWIKNNAS
jgi:group I intron endonuclease